jgi:hypothetical protein
VLVAASSVLGAQSVTDASAIAALARISCGTFRLIDWFFTQVERILKIKELGAITAGATETARSTLVIGIS